MSATKEVAVQIQRLSEAVDLLVSAGLKLEEKNKIYGPGNIVRVQVPRISHLLP